MDELAGKIVGGRFRIVRLIGEGGMGAVYEAHHEVLPRRFAIKVLRPKLSRDQTFVERFRREAIASSRLEHPNIIYITDFGATEDGAFYLVMEYLEGVGLDELLRRFTRLPLHRALLILAQIADALDHAHKMNVVHRDLKPENILLCEVRGQKDFVKLLDFGIAKVQTPEFANIALTVKGQVFGTAEYMSPEQALGNAVDGRADLYALGCLAYELLTGDPPFLGTAMVVLQAHVKNNPPPPSSKLRDHHIPPALDGLVLRCLAKNPDDRYQTGAELRYDFLRVRALLFQMSDEIMARNQAPASVQDRQKMTEGWHKLDAPIPELLLFTSTQGVMEGGPPSTVTSRQAAVASSEDLRQGYHDLLRELAIALVQATLAPAAVSDDLERLLVLEEEIVSLTGTIALSEQKFDRLRFEFGQKEKCLRFAILDLSMAQAQLKGRAAQEAADALKPQIDDLSFQISTLNHRCREIETERGVQINELAEEVKNYRDVRQKLEKETIELFQTLHARLEALRPIAIQPALQKLFQKLDGLLSSLGRAKYG